MQSQQLLVGGNRTPLTIGRASQSPVNKVLLNGPERVVFETLLYEAPNLRLRGEHLRASLHFRMKHRRGRVEIDHRIRHARPHGASEIRGSTRADAGVQRRRASLPIRFHSVAQQRELIAIRLGNALPRSASLAGRRVIHEPEHASRGQQYSKNQKERNQPVGAVGTHEIPISSRRWTITRRRWLRPNSPARLKCHHAPERRRRLLDRRASRCPCSSPVLPALLSN